MFASESWTDLYKAVLPSDIAPSRKQPPMLLASFNARRYTTSITHYMSPPTNAPRKPCRALISLHAQVSRCPSFTLTLLLENSNSLLSASSSSLTWCERVAMPICCSSGRSVAREAQIQPSETSMKLQILSGTIVSAKCVTRVVSSVGKPCGLRDCDLQVRSSEMEKSWMYLNRTKVAMQALLNFVISSHASCTRMRVQKNDLQRPKSHRCCGIAP